MDVKPSFSPSQVRLIQWPSDRNFITVMVGRVTYASIRHARGQIHVIWHLAYHNLDAHNQAVIKQAMNDYRDMCVITARLNL